MEESRIKLNVMGRLFEIPLSIIQKIPYFNAMLENCDINCIPHETIFVARSSTVFDHVLSFVVDPLYPFPIEYAYELDFYDVKYDASKLYQPHIILANKLNKIIQSTNHLEIKVDCLLIQNEWFESGIKSIRNVQIYNKYICSKCNNSNCKGSITCYKCSKFCVEYDCKKLSDVNYCLDHVTKGLFCNTKRCAGVRIKGEVHCCTHIQIYKIKSVV